MSLDMDLDQPHKLEKWSAWFKAELAPTDLDGHVVLAFMYYFADRGIFEPVDENRWKLFAIDSRQPAEQVKESIRKHLEVLSQTESGFAIAYFLGQKPKVSSKPLKDEPERNPRTIPDESKPPNKEKASDLSNLQIVKKVGRQLRPFLDFEKDTVARLLGTHTRQKEARTIFNYILRLTQTKARPKEWEQISRKRHK